MGDHEGIEIMPALKKLVSTITYRLRYSSCTWVRFSVNCCNFMMVHVLLCCMYLLRVSATDRTTTELSATIMVGIVYCVVAICFLLPLAFVSETFQYDVVKALNTPLTLNRAQQFFGQQFLAHLHTLDWGFR